MEKELLKPMTYVKLQSCVNTESVVQQGELILQAAWAKTTQSVCAVSWLSYETLLIA